MSEKHGLVLSFITVGTIVKAETKKVRPVGSAEPHEQTLLVLTWDAYERGLWPQVLASPLDTTDERQALYRQKDIEALEMFTWAHKVQPDAHRMVGRSGWISVMPLSEQTVIVKPFAPEGAPPDPIPGALTFVDRLFIAGRSKVRVPYRKRVGPEELAIVEHDGRSLVFRSFEKGGYYQIDVHQRGSWQLVSVGTVDQALDHVLSDDWDYAG